VVASHFLNLCKQNLHQLFIYLLKIIVWVYKFLTPKLCLVFGRFLEQVIVSQVVVIGVVGGLNIGVVNEGRRPMESRDKVMDLWGSSLHSNHSKLSDITAGKLSMSPSSLHTIPTKPWPLNGANHPLVAFTGSGKSCNKKQTCHLPRKYSVQSESSSPFLVKSWVCVEAELCEIWSHVFHIKIVYRFSANLMSWVGRRKEIANSINPTNDCVIICDRISENLPFGHKKIFLENSNKSFKIYFLN